jgi:DNA replication ATP-dependent helicase Dna2
LSRVAFVSRGASAALIDQGVFDVPSLAQLQPTSAVFDAHYSLRATRNVVSGRAAALQQHLAAIPPQSGTSGVMPRYADLHIYLTVDFDLGSAITFAIGAKGFWVEPQPFGFVGQRATHAYGPHIHVIDQKDLAVERREVLAFLNELNTALSDARARDPETTVQFYIWDSVQYEHLTRIIGRHLHAILADQSIQHLAWLFPPEELLPNAVMETRRSPITIVRDVVRALLAVPIPHYYTLFHTARLYHDAALPPQIAAFSVHPLFEDSLSDQIPSERAHEIWVRATRPRLWSDQLRTLQETISKQLQALETIARRLEQDLRQSLQQIAPRIRIEPPARQSGISFDGQLWYGFARLNAALGELEVHQIRAMPPEEREARYRSARLSRGLVGAAEAAALVQLGIGPLPGQRIYEMRPTSCELKAREGDFSFSLAPEDEPGILDRAFQQVTQGTALELPDGAGWRTYVEAVTSVTIVAIDRDRGLLVVTPNSRYPTMLDDLEQLGLLDFSQNVILDPTWIDVFTRKLLSTLHAIGNPPNARNNPLVRRAVGLAARRLGNQTGSSPAGDLLWSGSTLAATVVPRDLTTVRQLLEQHGISLNPSQWLAWESSLGHRLQTVWGPPGTGKSRTLRAVALGAVVDAAQRGAPLRILICAPTYNALDNVLLETIASLHPMIQHPDLCSVRIRSNSRPRDPHVPIGIDLELDKWNPSPALQQLRQRLHDRTGITVVGATPEQTHNLLVTARGIARQEFFDVIILDEASQVDVGHSILPFAALAANGSVVVAGDPKQLPPIHQAKAPVGLETMVGSVYEFFERVHQVQPAVLQENYRSNCTIVELAHEAGYVRSLRSFSPDLRIDIVTALPVATPPTGWPQALFWSPEWAAILDPASPACCFVYPEGRSSQWNPFEADAVAALAFLLFSRLGDQLLNERDPRSGAVIPANHIAYTMEDFWSKGIGIVTPHRAQQALVVARLQQIFGPLGASPDLIRNAVDTVERFQGQQRDVIVASFALGDQDAIHNEDEFLMSLNRFNVMTSRARAKLITLVTQEVVNHLSGELDVLRQSRLLKVFVESFCTQSRPIRLGHIRPSGIAHVDGLLKWRL